MSIKVVQWNIGGGRIRSEDADAAANSSYSVDGIQHIISKLIELAPDVVTFQESHANSKSIQAQVIAEAAGYAYWINDEYDDSHVEKGQRLCQSVLSKCPIEAHTFNLFKNPNFTTITEEGETWTSHDKGYTKVEIQFPEHRLGVGTLHLVPFSMFKKPYSDEMVLEILQDVSDKVMDTMSIPFLLQGDFNLNSVSIAPYFPNMFRSLQEIPMEDSTTPKGRKYDHVVYAGLQVLQSKVHDEVLTDHYLICSEFELI